MSGAGRPKLVVVGCGFAGYSLLRGLRREHFDVTLVSPRNYFLFTPLLPSAATGTVEFRSIVEPARRRLRHVRVVEGRAVGVDWPRRRLAAEAAVGGASFEIEFDQLVVAVGAETATFGVPGAVENAIAFTELEHARAVRRRVLEQFARADVPGADERAIAAGLTFVVCGGGPTGVEVAAEIHDLIVGELKRAFPPLASRARVVLVEAGPRLLASFDDALADYAARHFRREGIELRVDSPVAEVRAEAVVLASGESIATGLVVWAAGTAPSAFVRALGVELDRAGRILTAADLRVPGREHLWAAGDCAALGDPPLPATAQVAQQAGAHLARALVAVVTGREPEPFRFRSFGMLAYVGGSRALVDLPGVKWSGRWAWFFWRSVYLTKLVSFANKAKVLFDWLKARLFGRDLARF
jgi:NADH:ubiquinone reductase (non-electrogenic)